MKPFTKILVPVDFSPHSDEAVGYAAELAQRYQASITLVHVYEPVAYALPEGYVPYTPDQLASMLATSEGLLNKAKEQAHAAGATNVQSRQLQGSVASEIAEFARSEGFNLIVMGTHGRRGLSRALMGSVAETVLRRAPCPVLAVKAEEVTTNGGIVI
jgi:nucleotide-binding universal stress UspA family protein